MDHHFDVELACEVGTDKAIILHNIVFWIQHNRANEIHEHDDHFWTYNTAQAFTDIMPYISKFRMYRLLQDLTKNGYLLSTDKYNDNSYDKTKWYALGEKMAKFDQLPKDVSQSQQDVSQSQPESAKAEPLANQENRACNTVASSSQNCDIEVTELRNHIGTDINPDKNQDIKPDKKHFSSSFENSPNNKGAPTKQMTTIERKEYLKDSIRRVKIRETG